jgi:hypothetical protein
MHDAEIASLLGRALTASGRFAEAAVCHRHATSQAPHDPAVHAAALVDALADPACRPGDAVAGVRAWGRKFGERRTPGLARSTSVATRPLVVGLFVAGNAGSAEAKALTHAPRSRSFHHGRLRLRLAEREPQHQFPEGRRSDVGDCDPLTFAAMVEAEEIDILIDLAGLSVPHLLIAFGGRMAALFSMCGYRPFAAGMFVRWPDGDGRNIPGRERAPESLL